MDSGDYSENLCCQIKLSDESNIAHLTSGGPISNSGPSVWRKQGWMRGCIGRQKQKVERNQIL
jgi:hypothetical protein